MTEQPKPRPQLTPYSDLGNHELAAELETLTRHYLTQQSLERSMASLISIEEDNFLVEYEHEPVTVASLRRILALVEAQVKDLKKAIDQGEAGIKTAFPDVIEARDHAQEQAKGFLEHIGFILAEMTHRGIKAAGNEDVMLGQVDIGGKLHMMLVCQIRQSQSWIFDANTFLAALSPERRDFFTVTVKPGHGEISTKMANEWLRRVIAEGTAPAGVQFAPMVLAKVGGDDLIYLVPIESTSTTEVSDADQ